jgi:hypothetical protein
MKQPSCPQMLKRCPAMSNKLKSSDIILQASCVTLSVASGNARFRRLYFCSRRSLSHDQDSGARNTVATEVVEGAFPLRTNEVSTLGSRPALDSGVGSGATAVAQISHRSSVESAYRLKGEHF